MINTISIFWVFGIIVAFVAMLVIALLLIKSIKVPKNMSKKDLESVLASSSDKAKEVTTQALNVVAENVSDEFEKELNEHVKKSLEKFSEKLEKTLNGAVTKYSETLDGVEEEVRKYLTATEKVVASNTQNLNKQLEDSIEAQKKMVVGKVQTKLNAILASYLNQSLEGSVDISSQQDFILQQLEKSKEALIEDLNNASP